MSILIFLAVLFVLVLVHELGHFIVAKWTGMRVDEFGIGFPPKLFGIKKGETEYTLNALPLGGFVKIFGEDAIVNSDGSVQSKTEGLFTSKSKWAQSAVLVAGVTMNVLLAWVLMVVVFVVGISTVVSESDASPEAELTITTVLPESPAERAKLPSGAILKEISVGDARLEALTPSAFSGLVSEHADTPITLAYTYKGELRVSHITPEKGLIKENMEQPALGVSLALIDEVHYSVLGAIKKATVSTVTSLRDITVGLSTLIFDAFRFKADLTGVAGPVGIVGLVGEASAFGIPALLMFTAFISLNLAVINLLPFPALDGGRLLFVIIEAVKGTPINPRISGALNTVGFMLLMLLMVAVTWNDIARLM